MSDTPPGAPPFKGRIAAERELLEALWYASQTFRDEGDGGLEGCKIACRAVARFLAVRHRNPELAAPLLALHGALIRLHLCDRSAAKENRPEKEDATRAGG